MCQDDKGKRIKIAFVHWNGLSAGGTERFLQTIAANLPQDKYLVDYYYAGEVAPHRKKYMEEHNINLIEFHFDKKIEKGRYTYFSNCDFKHVFKGDYDLVQAGRYGSPESFFACIKGIPIIDSVHYVSGVDNRYEISRVMHISEFSKNAWVEKGGDKRRTVMISLPLFLPEFQYTDIRKKLGLKEDCFIFGFHQANRDGIFSDIPLRAYKEVESDKNAFVVCNGSKLYREQAKKLGLKNIYFFDYLANDDEFYSVIKSFNVYAHGRKDGELNSAAIAEAMSFGLPVITHPSDAFNGHLEVVRGNGFVANNYQEYAGYMKLLEEDSELHKKCSKASRELFESKYDFDVQMNNITAIYEAALQNPYPGKLRRCMYSWVQRIATLAKWIVYRRYYLQK